MFKFSFDLDDLEADSEILKAFEPAPDDGAVESNDSSSASAAAPKPSPCCEVSINDVLSALPPVISYSPLTLALTDARPGNEDASDPVGDKPAKTLILFRRDLYDVRYQLISQDGGSGGEGDKDKNGFHNETQDGRLDVLNFIESPSDLVPGLYEGGLKTWECSLDLVHYLHGLGVHPVGRRIFEIGCGTGVPSLYLLSRIFCAEPLPESSTVIHLQDYNRAVLELVTFPNILLTWYMSPASALYRASHAEQDENTSPHPFKPGELRISPELKKAFLASLETFRLDLRLFSGAWDTFDRTRTYNIVLTSETIYQSRYLPTLIDLLLCVTDKMPVPPQDAESRAIERYDGAPLCLVAAKTLYFGVGSGTVEFEQAIQAVPGNARTETVWEHSSGVSRKIMRVYR
ncbi:hypothetical protein FISHEDRAFT_66750 [Fistulina hepatica ATCC 64428]|uniref:protein-histidine N-methyltransferase n=1 Tax=Fistulina hepatica ATCC 64428 TaxID=1128425 RepID=A0A0D7A597_9AGAR|nr:hypothetical protein FISHEDRAFT_66750 [Fistulina hepatica ATCC 64428]